MYPSACLRLMGYSIGFSGDNCETDPDNCVGKPCKNGGKCRDLPNAYECICLPGFDDIK